MAAAPAYHIAMYPWYAFGHLIPFLHLANKLAKAGHKISFLLPPKLYSITLIPITVPHVDGLPPAAETTSDVPFTSFTHIMTAMDRTGSDIEVLLRTLKPSIKSIYYCVVSSVTIGYIMSPARRLSGNKLTKASLMQPPLGFPDLPIKLKAHEAEVYIARRIMRPYADYVGNQFDKPVLFSGPVIPEPYTSALEEKWYKWLGEFKASSVIYCAFGSECTLEKDQFEELLLGLELTGMPFMAALKPPAGYESIEPALPQGFQERICGRGIVHGGWVQQQLILEHPSVGCFITHCGSSSLSEALINKCQMVLLPHVGDHVFQARMMSLYLKVGVEVEKGEEDGLFTKETVYKAVRTLMEEESVFSREVKTNRAKLREFLSSKTLESSYIESFNEQLQALLG
ncbi:anthocyanidin O-glucoside 2''-O-glucosyltransferase [Salix suchowensis]|nr:anthocyanidin O-glucoside 2''-O-glucosyltransferase [Salix suchowensis]